MHRVIDLQYALQKLTRVPPARQKLLGIVKGKLPPRDAFMCVVDALNSALCR